MSTRIAIVDYEMGNLRSVSSALAHLGAEAVITDDPSEASAANGVILPGVGAFGDAAQALENRDLSAPLRELALTAAEGGGTPFLGICLGLQLLFATSEEAPGVDGLGVISGSVLRFSEKDLDGNAVKVPHMGWNSVRVENANPLTSGLGEDEYFYFVHSYYTLTEAPSDMALSCDYAGLRFSAMVARGKLFATQFHPEKSQSVGLGMLKNFVEMCR